MPIIDNSTLRDLLDKTARGGHASRCVQSFDYDLESETLTIEFPGNEPGARGGAGTYEYTGVPLSEFVNFAQAGSLGTYFNLYIRDRYSYNRVS